MKKFIFSIASLLLVSNSYASNETAETHGSFPPGWQGAIVCTAQNVFGKTFQASGFYTEPRSEGNVQEDAMRICAAMSDRQNCWATGCHKA